MSLRRSFLLITLFTLVPLTAIAQTTASLSGRIVDESNAPMPGVTVLVRQEETGLQRSAISGQDGRYTFAVLPPGAYEIRAEVSGFKPLVRRGVTLTIGQAAVADLTMAIGVITETVTIEIGRAHV